MKFLIGSDIVPTSATEKYFVDGDVKTLYGGVVDLCRGMDRIIINGGNPLQGGEHKASSALFAFYHPADNNNGVSRLEHTKLLSTAHIEGSAVCKLYGARHMHHIDILLFHTVFEKGINRALCQFMGNLAIPVCYHNSIALT